MLPSETFFCLSLRSKTPKSKLVWRLHTNCKQSLCCRDPALLPLLLLLMLPPPPILEIVSQEQQWKRGTNRKAAIVGSISLSEFGVVISLSPFFKLLIGFQFHNLFKVGFELVMAKWWQKQLQHCLLETWLLIGFKFTLNRAHLLLQHCNSKTRTLYEMLSLFFSELFRKEKKSG